MRRRNYLFKKIYLKQFLTDLLPKNIQKGKNNKIIIIYFIYKHDLKKKYWMILTNYNIIKILTNYFIIFLIFIKWRTDHLF